MIPGSPSHALGVGTQHEPVAWAASSLGSTHIRFIDRPNLTEQRTRPFHQSADRPKRSDVVIAKEHNE